MPLEPDQKALDEEEKAFIDWLMTADEKELRKQLRIVEKEIFRKDTGS